MNRATLIVRKLAVKPANVIDTITLDHQDRHRRRMAMKADGGLEFLLDLNTASVLDDGDALKLEDGKLVRISAKPEDLFEITTENPLRLMKVAWHLGNRHVPAEVTKDAIYIAPDHVLIEMVRGLGAKAEPVTRAFRPEQGAYHEHASHDHGHDHAAHDHAHKDHDDKHDHSHDHEHDHAHGDACGCGHDHH
jgi:urease accessory protein